MKKILTIIVALTAFITVVSCGNRGNNSRSNSKTSEHKRQETNTESIQCDSATKRYYSFLTNGYRCLNEAIIEFENLHYEVSKKYSYLLNKNIDNMSIQDLRLLRSSIYATHGYLFTDADLRGYAEAEFPEYKTLMWTRWEIEYLGDSVAKIKLTEKEQNFINKIDKKTEELKKQNYISSGNFKIANTQNIINKFQFKDIKPDFIERLKKNNMVIVPGKDVQLFHIYENNDYHEIPSFITTDLMLQAFNMYFSYTLKLLEMRRLSPALTSLTYELYKASFEQAQNPENKETKLQAEYNAVFFAIPYYLFTGKKLEIPARYKNEFEEELKNIESQADASSDFLDFEEGFPYSQFKPRGHYTRNEILSKYFTAMQWLQLAPYCREKEKQLKDAIFVADILKNKKLKDGRTLLDLYRSIYEPIVFFVGEADNLSIMDIAMYLQSGNSQGGNMEDVNTFLINLSKQRNRISAQVELSCHDKINFMPARYLADNEILNEMADTRKNAERAFPRGLDVFAAFGSQTAMNILLNTYNDNKNWKDFESVMAEEQQKFSNYKGWNISVYNKWIESLTAMQQSDKSYPDFMQLPAWSKKNLNTSLASWTNLKHNTVLYGEQPSASECGGGEDEDMVPPPPEPRIVGYVEPNIRFWTKLKELILLTEKILVKNKFMDNDLKRSTGELKDYVEFLLTVSKKEIRKEKLTDAEYKTIEVFGSSIEYFTLSVIAPDVYFNTWSEVKGPDKNLAIVTDVYTRNIAECSKNGVLHEAVGLANNIYVLVEIEGCIYLTKGAVFSYYEFVKSPNTRLTDEEWQKMLEENKAPAVPKWMDDIMTKTGEPKADERVFYSSGC